MRSILISCVVLSSISLIHAYLYCIPTSPVVTVDYCEQNCNNVDNPYCPENYCSCSEGAAPAASSGTLYCKGNSAQSSADDDWCTFNCNNVPPFCPTALCTCAATSAALGSTSSGLTCHSIQEPATDQWCTNNCNRMYCPADYCECGETGTPTSSPVATPTAGPTAFYGTCAGYTDLWCTATCNHSPSVCPAACCSATVPTPTGSPVPTPTAVPAAQYYSTCPPYTDEWCTSSCNHVPAVCPDCCSLVPANVTFVSQCDGIDNAWCTATCTHDPSVCPAACCVASANAPQTPGGSSATPYYANPACPTFTNAWCTSTCDASAAACPSQCCSATAYTFATTTHFYGRCAGVTDAWCSSTCTHNPSVCPAPCCTSDINAAFPTTMIYHANDSCKPVFTDEWCTANCNADYCHSCCVAAGSVTVLPVFASLHVTQSANSNVFDEANMKLTPIGEDLYGTLLLTYLQAAGAIATPAGKSVHLLQQSWTAANKKATSFSGVVDFEIIGITNDEATDAANAVDDVSSLSTFVSGMTTDIVITNSEGALHEETDGHAQGFTGKGLDLEDFRCADGASISLAAVCDGVEDCNQGEDELFCD